MKLNDNKLDKIEILLDNSGGITIQNTLTKAVCIYPDHYAAADSIAAIYDGEDMSDWDHSDADCYISDEYYSQHAPNGGIRIIGKDALEKLLVNA
jgi:hypothetical protein